MMWLWWSGVCGAMRGQGGGDCFDDNDYDDDEDYGNERDNDEYD